ncbi:MAG: hypothetical protein OXH79_12160 [Boseongicola sp.]|nr:hypothetical protein [Boseongicola sp.]
MNAKATPGADGFPVWRNNPWNVPPKVRKKNMKLVHLCMLITVAALAAACAKRPDDIAAVPMDTASYETMSCRSLAVEETRITADLNTLSAAQESAADSDALGVFLLGIPWSSMSGNDKETLISVAKGRLDAIDMVQASKSCG